MHDRGMQEQIRYDLPYRKSLNDACGHQCKVLEEAACATRLQDKTDDENAAVRYQKPFQASREAIRRNVSIHVRARTEGHLVRGLSPLRIAKSASPLSNPIKEWTELPSGVERRLLLSPQPAYGVSEYVTPHEQKTRYRAILTSWIAAPY